MSTKTSIKRVALVAVAALGLGVLSSVAPASAARTITSLSAGTPTPSRVGVTSSVTITASHVAATSDTFTVAAKISGDVPTGSTIKTTTNSATNGVYIAAGVGSALSGSVTGGSGTAYADISQTSGTATSTKFTINFTPDKAGTYTVLVSTGHSTFTAGDSSVAVVFTTVGAPTTIALSRIGGYVTNSSTSTYGALFSVSLKDANGNATVLGQDETLDISVSDTTNISLTDNSFSSADEVLGAYYVKAYKAATITSSNSGAATLTVKGGGLLSPTLTSNISVSKVATSAAVTSDVVTCYTSTNCTSATGGTASDTGFTANVAGATKIKIAGLSSSADADITYGVNVTNTSTGTAVQYADYVTLAQTTTAGATTYVTYTVPAPSLLGTTAISGYGDNGVTLTYVKPYVAAITVQGSDAVLSATAAKNTFVALVEDQYGNAVPYAAVSVSVAGRNTVASKALGVTDANGLISYSITDAGTTGTADTITLSVVGGSGGVTTYTDTASITYGTASVSTVTVSGGSKAETVAGSTLTAISAADNGPEGSAVAISAVVKDANGNLLAGVPVTFSVDKGLVKKTSAVDYSTVYTGSNGKATSYVFNWTPGTQTITATAGGKSGTDYLTWAATDATSARVLSATANGNVVSVKVVDRFGNAVKGVSVDLSRVGTGFFGNGTSTATVKTDATGTADIQFNGTATVTATLDTATYTQSADVAGEIDATAVTAAVAGTTKGTGASLAPAGVNKVTVDLTDSSSAAVDAANEATDAANAATDAANAAAEAADAATAAAQDAQAAVAALATQVASLIAGIKAQITALTNLVIKIQTKVKA